MLDVLLDLLLLALEVIVEHGGGLTMPIGDGLQLRRQIVNVLFRTLLVSLQFLLAFLQFVQLDAELLETRVVDGNRQAHAVTHIHLVRLAVLAFVGQFRAQIVDFLGEHEILKRKERIRPIGNASHAE